MVPRMTMYHEHQSFVYTQLNDQTVSFSNNSVLHKLKLNGSKNDYVSRTSVICLHTVKWSNSSISNNSI